MECSTWTSNLRYLVIAAMASYFAVGTSRDAAAQTPTLVARKQMSGGTLVFSPDSRLGVTFDKAQAVLWDVKTLRKLRAFTGHTNLITSAAFAGNGRIVTTSLDGTVRVWDVETGKELRRLAGHGSVPPNARDRWAGSRHDQYREAVLTAVVTRDGRYVVTGGADHTARIWDIETGRQRRRFHETQDGDIAHVKISSDKRLVLTGGIGSFWSGNHGAIRAVQIWDVQTGRPIHAGSSTQECVNFSSHQPDGRS